MRADRSLGSWRKNCVASPRFTARASSARGSRRGRPADDGDGALSEGFVEGLAALIAGRAVDDERTEFSLLCPRADSVDKGAVFAAAPMLRLDPHLVDDAAPAIVGSGSDLAVFGAVLHAARGCGSLGIERHLSALHVGLGCLRRSRASVPACRWRCSPRPLGGPAKSPPATPVPLAANASDGHSARPRHDGASQMACEVCWPAAARLDRFRSCAQRRAM